MKGERARLEPNWKGTYLLVKASSSKLFNSRSSDVMGGLQRLLLPLEVEDGSSLLDVEVGVSNGEAGDVIVKSTQVISWPGRWW